MDPPLSNLEKKRELAADRIAWFQRTEWDGQLASPSHFDSDVVTFRDDVEDFVALTAKHLLPLFGAREEGSSVAARALGYETIGQLVLLDIVMEERRERVTGGASLEGGDEPAGKSSVVGGGRHGVDNHTQSSLVPASVFDPSKRGALVPRPIAFDGSSTTNEKETP